MSDSLTLRISGGTLLLPDQLRAAIERTMADPILVGATHLGIAILNATPRRSGTLQGGWDITDKPKWDGDRYGVAVFNEVIYARRVYREGKSAGYADRGIATGKADAIAAIKAGGPTLAAALWVPA